VEVERGDAPDSRRAHLKSDGDFGDANELLYYRINTFFTVYALSDGNESVIERYHYDGGACPERHRRCRETIGEAATRLKAAA